MYKKLLLGSSLVTLVLAGAGCMGDTTVPTNTSTPNTTTTAFATTTNNTTSTNDGSDFLATTSIATDGITGSILPSGTTRPANGNTPVAGSANDPSTKAYLAALKIYDANGYRYQFANCSGLPGTFTIKKNVKFMLDNRDGERHVLGFNGARYSVPAYSYVIASINKAGNFFITCDGGGAAQVKVQN